MRTYEHFKFFNFCIIVKRQYVNGVLIGSAKEISKKLNLSYFLTKKYLNYGIKHKLIDSTSNGFKIASYDKLITSLSLDGKIENYSFFKTGSFQNLIINNSFIIALYNFKAQQFKINQKENKLQILKKVFTTGQRVTKREYQISKDNTCVENIKKSIVTGQKHLSKVLGFSQQTAFNLIKIWASFGFIERKVVFSKKIDPFYNNYCLNTKVGKLIVLGSAITINPLVVTNI